MVGRPVRNKAGRHLGSQRSQCQDLCPDLKGLEGSSLRCPTRGLTPSQLPEPNNVSAWRPGFSRTQILVSPFLKGNRSCSGPRAH